MAPAQNPFSFTLIPNAPLCLFDDRSFFDDLEPGVRFEFSDASGKSFNLKLPPTNGNSIRNSSSRLACSTLRGEIKKPSKSTDANTQFTYDPLGRCVKIVETVASSVTSTKQVVWCGAQRCEERDGSGSLSNGKQFFPLGQVNFASGTPTNYFYTQDHLGSTREMTKTVSGTTTIEAQYAYDPYGIATKLQGSQDADFQYAGYYMHARSGLNLTRTRQYSATLGRWISRDPIAEAGGVNLYGYVGNRPILYSDPSGLIDWAQVQAASNSGALSGAAFGAGAGGIVGAFAGAPAGGIGAVPGAGIGAALGGAGFGAIGGFAGGLWNLAGQLGGTSCSMSSDPLPENPDIPDTAPIHPIPSESGRSRHKGAGGPPVYTGPQYDMDNVQPSETEFGARPSSLGNFGGPLPGTAPWPAGESGYQHGERN